MNQIQPIQALRGLAVMLVVLGHWGLFFGSGYIGVDVFFVISGYVVTLVSLRRAQSGRFSVVQFMQARFIRLFPALGATVLVVVCFQLFYYPSFEWSRASGEGLSSALWMSNFYSHARLGDYFGENAGTSLLLHTWSLSVEFQAYIVLAILYFWALAKTKSVRNLRIALVFLSTISLSVALASQLNFGGDVWQAVASYYSPVTRFYQIGTGALLATLSGSRSTRPRRNLLFGVVTLVAIGLLPHGLVSWNLVGLAAVGASVIFIWSAKSQSRINLPEKLMAKVGDYSYSIYLWHWPILVVSESVFQEVMEQILIGAVLTILISFLSYRILEVPFIGARNQLSVNRIKVRGVYSSAITLSFALLISATAWSSIKPENFESTPGVLAGDVTQAGFAREFNRILSPCFGAISQMSQNVGEVFDCYETSDSKNVDVLIIGNSHAAHLIPGIVAVTPNVKLRYLAFSGGFTPGNPELRKALDYWVASGSSAEHLFVNSFWEIENIDTGEIQRTILESKVEAKDTYVFNDVPNFKISPVRCKYSVLFPIPSPCSERITAHSYHLKNFESVISEKLPIVNLISSSRFFMIGRDTFSLFNGHYIYFRDQNHLNVSGSEGLFEYLDAGGFLPDLD